jgi:hypothetical protein
MKKTGILLRWVFAFLFCLSAAAAINPTSAAGRDRHDRDCRRRCDAEYDQRKIECRNERGRERRRCEERAKREHKECKHHCR